MSSSSIEKNTLHGPTELQKVKVTSNLQLGGVVHLLGVENNFQFIPGQVIAVSSDLEIPPRLYSIASGASDEEVKILFDVKEAGTLTPRLSILKPGDKLYISKPFGNFTAREDPATWIATGTGIAPFAAMLFSGLGSNNILIHGSRNPEGFYFKSQFKKLLGKNYIQCCTGSTDEGVYMGRVTTYLSESDNLLLNRFYYLCGNAEMVVDVRQILLNRGIPFNKIMAEIYF
jgi:ferredoxin--NADP+ reductase